MRAFVTTSKVIGLNLKPAKLTEKDSGVDDNESNYNTRCKELKTYAFGMLLVQPKGIN